MDIHKKIATEILLRNNAPIADFENLSPNNFHHILYDTYSENSPVHFQKIIENETLDQVSLFRIAEEYIKIIERDKFIKLTPLGALPKKVMIELYEKKFIYDEMIESGITKLWREEDCIAIMSMKIATQLAGLTKKTKNKLILTKKGLSFLKPGNRQQFFELFISTFADKFNWGYNDLFPEKPIGQRGWTFTIYLLGKYGQNFQHDSFYAEKYLKAFPDFVTSFESDSMWTDVQQFAHCFAVRSFERFLGWFNLIEIDKNGKHFWNSETKIRATEILPGIFSIDM